MLYHAEGIYSFTSARNNCANWWNASWQGERAKAAKKPKPNEWTNEETNDSNKMAKAREKKNIYMTKIRFVLSNIMCVVMCGVGACALDSTYMGANYVSLATENMMNFVLVTRGHGLEWCGCCWCYWWCSHTQRIYLISSHFCYLISVFRLFNVLLFDERNTFCYLGCFCWRDCSIFKASQIRWLMKVLTVVINYRFFALPFGALAKAHRNCHTIENGFVTFFFLYFHRFVSLENKKKTFHGKTWSHILIYWKWKTTKTAATLACLKWTIRHYL